MWILTALGLGIGLAMDACAVSMSNGLCEPKMKVNKISLIAAFFGVFQCGMPIIGYLAVTLLNDLLGEKFTTIFGYLVPWIALILLSYLGIKMIVEAIKSNKEDSSSEEECSSKVLTIGTLFIQAIATSIDALSVGIIFAEQPAYIAYITFGIIGVLTFIISFVAVLIGKKFGTIFSNKAELVGGIILVLIGLEIFISNFNDVIEGLKAIFHFVSILF